jgi:hypothetical protein
LRSVAALVVTLPTSSGAAAATDSITLRVMSFNIFYGGDELNLETGQFCKDAAGCPETLDQVAVAIRASGADVVGLEEATMNTCPLALKPGWNCKPRTQVSPYPIIDPPGANGLYVFVEPSPGRVVAVSDVHLPADPYGPYEIRDGATLAEVLQLENELRVPDIQDELRALPPLAARGIPSSSPATSTRLTGDFNTPRTSTGRDGCGRPRGRAFPVQWPVSKALTNAGFKDSFRVVRPNPVAKPGFTWTPGSPKGEKVEVHDRIDWVLSMLVTATASDVVGEAGNPNRDIAVDPWPSDHRGIVSTFEVTPAPMPVLVAVEERSRGPGGDAARSLPRRCERGSFPRLDHGDFEIHRRRRRRDALVATTHLAPGAYQAVLRNSSGQALSRSPFWLYAPGSVTTVQTAKSVYKVGEPIRVSWKKAPGMKFDWLGLYSAGESADNKQQTTCSAGYCGNGRYLLYTYTHNTIEGSTIFEPSSFAGWKTWDQTARAPTRSVSCSTTATARRPCRRPSKSSNPRR